MKTLVGHNLKIILGTFVWSFGDDIVAQGVQYEGDTEEDVKARAIDSLAMFDRDKLPYILRAESKFYPVGQ